MVMEALVYILTLLFGVSTVIIIKNKEMGEIEGKLDYDVIKVGRRYTMIKGK